MTFFIESINRSVRGIRSETETLLFNIDRKKYSYLICIDPLITVILNRVRGILSNFRRIQSTEVVNKMKTWNFHNESKPEEFYTKHNTMFTFFRQNYTNSSINTFSKGVKIICFYEIHELKPNHAFLVFESENVFF